jgi:hypothetical protein
VRVRVRRDRCAARALLLLLQGVCCQTLRRVCAPTAEGRSGWPAPAAATPAGCCSRPASSPPRPAQTRRPAAPAQDSAGQRVHAPAFRALIMTRAQIRAQGAAEAVPHAPAAWRRAATRCRWPSTPSRAPPWCCARMGRRGDRHESEAVRRSDKGAPRARRRGARAPRARVPAQRLHGLRHRHLHVSGGVGHRVAQRLPKHHFRCCAAACGRARYIHLRDSPADRQAPM